MDINSSSSRKWLERQGNAIKQRVLHYVDQNMYLRNEAEPNRSINFTV